MARENKFRVWDGKEYRYFPDLKDWDISDYELFSKLSRENDPEQFAGLKDRNGKEIYEGDILANIRESFYPADWKPTPFKFPQYEEFQGGGLDYSVRGIGYCFDDSHPKMSECEVIGSLHENSDLLK